MKIVQKFTHSKKNFLKSYSIFSALVLGVNCTMSVKRTNGFPWNALDYPFYLIFYLSNENCTNNKYLFLSKSMKWKWIESYGSLIKLLTHSLEKSDQFDFYFRDEHWQVKLGMHALLSWNSNCRWMTKRESVFLKEHQSWNALLMHV